MVENMFNSESEEHVLVNQEVHHIILKTNNVSQISDNKKMYSNDLHSLQNCNENTVLTNSSAVQKLQEEILQLRLEMKNMNESRMLQNQQLLEQMKSVEINITKQIEAMHESLIKTLFKKLDTLQVKTEATTEYVEKTHNFLPVGTEINNSYHLGENIWVDAMALKHIRLYSDSASKFVGALAELVYTTEVLKTHTVTGTQCNANKGIPAKPKLCPIRYGVALAEYKRWLKEQMLTDEERKKKLSCFNRYISSKQGTLNSDPLQRLDKRKHNCEDTNELQKIVKKQNVATVINYVEFAAMMDADAFQESFRLTRYSFELLLQEIAPVIKADLKNQHSGRPEVPIERSVLLALWTLGNQEAFRAIADRFQVSDSCAHGTFFKVMNALVSMTPFYLTWPSGHGLTHIGKEFDEMSGTFPNVVGVVGATHVIIPSPKIDPDVYQYNKRSCHSIILQGICDASQCFMDVFIGWPGSGHSLQVWKNSPIGRTFEENAQFLSDECHLIGGTGYHLKTYLMVPYKNYQELTPAEENFNLELCAKSILIKQAFGKLKGRFKKLKYLNMTKIEEMKTVVMAACVLHNMIIKYNDSMDIRDTDDDELDDTLEQFEDEQKFDLTNSAIRKRDSIADYLYNNTL